ncbi:hypothetical protein ACLE20_13175 [Rhizobium sp. YIM 134829]|uniref:hypothetical protein n=1 Tax=Rhizobium sp. YIM 134829 TaxID=3390453 RepID=UPI003978E8E5
MSEITLREVAQDLLDAHRGGPHVSERADLWRALKAALAEMEQPPAPSSQELTIGDLLNQYFDQGRTGKHDEKADAIRLAIASALQKIRAEADDETYEIGKRDGYSEAVQDIDQRTGGDGEYRYCLGMEDDIRHQPDPATMIQRIVDRFEVLNLLDDATKTGRDQPDDTPAPQPQVTWRDAMEAAAKIAEEDRTPAYGPHRSDMEYMAEAQRKNIAERIRALTPVPQPLPPAAERDDRAEVEPAIIRELREAFADGAEDVHIFWAGKCRMHVTEQDLDALTAERDRLQTELDHFYALCVDDPGRNPPEFWKDIAARLQSENDSLMNEVTSFRSSFKEQPAFNERYRMMKERVEVMQRAHQNMHRRAQIAEGAMTAVMDVINGWAGYLKGLPEHDSLMRSIKAQIDTALAKERATRQALKGEDA